MCDEWANFLIVHVGIKVLKSTGLSLKLLTLLSWEEVASSCGVPLCIFPHRLPLPP